MSKTGVNAQTFLIEPFDINMHATAEGVVALQARFASWLRTLRDPARFVFWQVPASLNEKIGFVASAARSTDRSRRQLLSEYRRFYEELEANAHYQQVVCGAGVWNEDANPRALAGGMMSSFDTPVVPSNWPWLFQGRYEICEAPFWHLRPVGRPGGRPFWAVLSSFEFSPSTWNFFRPFQPLLRLNFPMAVAVDLPVTYDRNAAIDRIESVIQAYEVHLASSSGEDSRSVYRISDCRRTLEEINAGDLLHEVQIVIAVAADDLPALKERVQAVVNETSAWFSLRQEAADLLVNAIGFFTPKATKLLEMPETRWPVTSRELTFMLAPLGQRKLSAVDGVMRGEAAGGSPYPVFYNSWRDKRATHEIWVGQSGYGKTFALNCYLTREYSESGVPFDLLEPMGHGKHVAKALGLPWYVISARATKLNPQDVLFPTAPEQISHTIRLYETVLGRQLSGEQRQNLERGLLVNALELLYRGFADLRDITPQLTPTCAEVCDVLRGLGDTPAMKLIARELADEIAAVVTGNGPWAAFLNGHTTIDLSRAAGQHLPPRIFSFHEMEGDPIMLAVAYTQVLAAIRRDSLGSENPRIIAVDEVVRLMRHPSLLEFLIEAAKTFRTRRKKLICIDQNMSNFLLENTRQIFENSTIRVIFSQRQGMNVFKDDAAFQHFNDQHRHMIANLGRFHCVLDIQDEGLFYLYQRPSPGEFMRFRTT